MIMKKRRIARGLLAIEIGGKTVRLAEPLSQKRTHISLMTENDCRLALHQNGYPLSKEDCHQLLVRDAHDRSLAGREYMYACMIHLGQWYTIGVQS